jgi:hypothetical protein
MIPLLINESNISLDFSLRLSKCLVDSDLVVIGLTRIGPIRNISVLDYVVMKYCTLPTFPYRGSTLECYSGLSFS